MSDMSNGDGTKTAQAVVDLADNPEACREVAQGSIKRCMEKYGWTREEAERMFGNSR